MIYKSKVLDMAAFGYYEFTKGILAVDASENVTYKVSFDGGINFKRIQPFEEFTPNNGSRIVLEIKFSGNSNSDKYVLSVAGVFPLDIGTTVHFTSKSFSQTAVLGYGGRYNVSLIPDLYSVYYVKAGKKIPIADNYDPRQYVFSSPNTLNKENLIQGFLDRIDWAEIAVYDTFVDSSKMQQLSTAKIDLSCNLVDMHGGYVQYWALALL